MSRSSTRKSRQPILIAVMPVVMLFLLFPFRQTKIARQLENVTLDWRFEARAQSDPPADERILVVGIGEDSLERFGRWPWNRDIHAALLQVAKKREPAVVAFDLFFPEESQDPDHDLAFQQMLELYPNAVTGAVAEAQAEPYTRDSIGKTGPFSRVTGDIESLVGGPNGLVPIDPVAQAAWTGFVNSDPSEVDGMRWFTPLVVRLGDSVYPSLALQILMRLENVTPDRVEVELGEAIRFYDENGKVTREIPTNLKGEIRLNYRSFDGFTVADYSQLVVALNELPDSGEGWPADYPPITDQVLIVGQTAVGLSDFGSTPLLPNTPLVLVQATVLNSLLKGDYLESVSPVPIMVFWLALTWITLALLRNAPVTIGVSVPILLAGLYVVAGFYLFTNSNIRIPLFLPTASFLGLHMAAVTARLYRENRMKSRIKGMFGTYVSPEVVHEMVSAEDPPRLGGEECEITALFSDIQGFSTFSEELDAPKLVQLLNEYLGPLTDILTYNGGTLDKYIGDA
ncbi:MAG: adenylate/guanylate cyclase domain-containing protein, partial [Verrucomicrobiales bacterium]|nr:adenylate/guanylate cyclase domain-containing protein [Verrucomicrobiales bacterium]